jgi:hypothetical protein
LIAFQCCHVITTEVVHNSKIARSTSKAIFALRDRQPRLTKSDQANHYFCCNALGLEMAPSVDAEYRPHGRYRMSSGPQPGVRVEGLRSKMTHSGGKPDRNAALLQPCLMLANPVCCHPWLVGCGCNSVT